MIRINTDIRRVMMERYLRLQASVFGDFKDIDLSQGSMSKLYQIYLKENMMPTIMKEFDIAAQDVKNRPSFVANDNSVSISIGSNRIDISSDISDGDEPLDKGRFIGFAIKYLQEFFEIFKVGVVRMSYIEEEIIEILNDSTNCEIRNRYINVNRAYNDGKIIEWSSKSVFRDDWQINNKMESVNVNVTTGVRKINALRNEQPVVLDALVLAQDINTLAENTSPRLDMIDIEKFIKIATQKSEEIRLRTEG